VGLGGCYAEGTGRTVVAEAALTVDPVYLEFTELDVQTVDDVFKVII